MDYPLINPELDRRRRFMPADIITIQQRYKEGAKVRALAREYAVPASSIYYLIDPVFKAKRKEQARLANAKKRASLAYIARHRMLSNESHKYKRSISEEELQYDKEKLIIFKLKNPNYYKEWRKKQANKQ